MALFVLADTPLRLSNLDVFDFHYGHHQIGSITGTATLMQVTSTDGSFMVEFHGTGLTANGATPTGGRYTEMRAWRDGVEIVRLTQFGAADFSAITTNALALEVLRNQSSRIVDGEGWHSLIGSAGGTEFVGLERGDVTQAVAGNNIFHVSAEASWTPEQIPLAIYDLDGGTGSDRVVFHGGDNPGGFVDLRRSNINSIDTLDFRDGVTAILDGYRFALNEGVKANGLEIYGTASIIVTSFYRSHFTNYTMFADPSRWIFHDDGPHQVEIRNIKNATVTGNVASHDRLIAGGNATVIGAGGGDWLAADQGNNLIISGGVGDTLAGGLGNDTLVMNDAQDVIRNTNHGHDWLQTYVSVDLMARDAKYFQLVKVMGTADLDISAHRDNGIWMIGNPGNNRLIGNLQRDLLNGWSGSDTLIGGASNDTLNGGGWGDRLIGGAGRDRFVFQNQSGRDRLIDFETEGDFHDIIDLRQVDTITDMADLLANHLSTAGNALRITFMPGHHVDLVNVTAEQLTADHFLFAVPA